MSTTRLLLEQADKRYRFLRFDARPDGSLIISLDRDLRAAKEAMNFDMEAGCFVPDSERSSHTKVTCHTTGEIRYYCGSNQPKQIFYIDKLTALPAAATVAFFSIPRTSRLDDFVPATHLHDSEAVLTIPEGVDERLTFVVELAPLPAVLESYGAAINYEIYAAIVRLVPPSTIPSDEKLSDHFIHGVPNIGTLATRAIGIAEAEIDFHKKIHGQTPLIFREASGAYVVIASVPMRISPQLIIKFTRADLSCEQIVTGRQLVHKVRFWIRDKGGRNLREDLRQYIASIELNAEL